ncbi:DUF4384 domain-containing protein [Polycyclovorans algicola]|uniref:DUF4384 domain-containing protein n=1 Tax=Polycyclovorans algicola TaxID=616992 RepID=UPI000A073838|nr:DUF4384 domain-containing protein [Polycyclovorans algicola]
MPCFKPAAALASYSVAMLLAVASLASPMAVASEQRAMTAEQVTITSLAVPQSDLKVDVWTDRPNGVYADGDRARVFLKVNQAARVELVEVNSRGVKTVLFPNACQPNKALGAGQTVEVGVGQRGSASCPGIRVSQPYGLSVLKAVATTDPNARFQTGRVMTGAAPFALIGDSADVYARTMTVMVNQAPPQTKWATANVHYSVAPSASATASVPSSRTTMAAAPAAAIPAAYPLPAFKSDFGLNVRTGEASYRAGDALTFSVTAERRCDLRVVNVDHNGDYSVLSPNAMNESLTLQAGRAQFLPRSSGDVQVRLSGEAGTQTLLAVCAQNKSFWEVMTGRSAITEVKPTMTLEEILADRVDGLVARKAVTYQLLP